MELAFLVLGFLVGNVTGLSASPIAMALIPAIFTLAGGSILTFLSKISEPDRRLAARALLTFSLGCLAGIYLGIVVTTHRLLGEPASDRASAAAEPGKAAPPRSETAEDDPPNVERPSVPAAGAVEAAARPAARAAKDPPAPARHLAPEPALRGSAGERPEAAAASHYLRGSAAAAADAIDQQVRNGTLSPEEGYRRLVALVRGRQP